MTLSVLHWRWRLKRWRHKDLHSPGRCPDNSSPAQTVEWYCARSRRTGGLKLLHQLWLKSAVTIARSCQFKTACWGFNGFLPEPFLRFASTSWARWESSSADRVDSVKYLINGVKMPSLPVNAWPDLKGFKCFVEIEGVGHVPFFLFYVTKIIQNF